MEQPFKNTEKTHQLRILYLAKISFKKMKANKDFFKHKNVNGFIPSRPALQKMLKKSWQKENDIEWKLYQKW